MSVLEIRQAIAIALCKDPVHTLIRWAPPALRAVGCGGLKV